MSSQKLLPFRDKQVPPPEGVTAVDSILIEPQSRGRLQAGEYSPKNPQPRFRVVISSLWPSQIQQEEKKLGSEARYTLVYEVSNYSEWPAFAHLERMPTEA